MNEDLIFILKLIRNKNVPVEFCNKTCFEELCCANCVLDADKHHRYSSVIFKYKGE